MSVVWMDLIYLLSIKPLHCHLNLSFPLCSSGSEFAGSSLLPRSGDHEVRRESSSPAASALPVCLHRRSKQQGWYNFAITSCPRHAHTACRWRCMWQCQQWRSSADILLLDRENAGELERQRDAIDRSEMVERTEDNGGSRAWRGEEG